MQLHGTHPVLAAHITLNRVQILPLTVSRPAAHATQDTAPPLARAYLCPPPRAPRALAQPRNRTRLASSDCRLLVSLRARIVPRTPRPHTTTTGNDAPSTMAPPTATALPVIHLTTHPLCASPTQTPTQALPPHPHPKKSAYSPHPCRPSTRQLLSTLAMRSQHARRPWVQACARGGRAGEQTMFRARTATPAAVAWGVHRAGRGMLCQTRTMPCEGESNQCQDRATARAHMVAEARRRVEATWRAGQVARACGAWAM